MRSRGFRVVPVDVCDNAMHWGVRPMLYDGVRLPIETSVFDVALLLTVLHHTADPERVLLEAARVADRVVVIEDTFHARLKGILTMTVDSLANFEFRGHPHTNRTGLQWRRTFRRLGLRLRAARTDYLFGFFEQTTYWLDASSLRADEKEA